MGEPSVMIGIATYKRPDLLTHLLSTIARCVYSGSVRVVVVDNDPAQSARSTVENAGPSVEYVAEPEPGIAAARNRVLDLMRPTDDYLVFVDDDEYVTRDWISQLVRTAEQTGADVVSGPVLPVFPADAPRWAIRGGFYERKRYATGARIPVAATNNTLVRGRVLSESRLRFDAAFSETGGSDTDFFFRLAKRGSRMVWCDEAVVSETVPRDRMTVAWVRARARRTGEVRGRILLAEGRYIRLLLEATARIVLGAARVVVSFFRRTYPEAWSLNTLLRGHGMLRVLFGRLTKEYSRS